MKGDAEENTVHFPSSWSGSGCLETIAVAPIEWPRGAMEDKRVCRGWQRERWKIWVLDSTVSRQINHREPAPDQTPLCEIITFWFSELHVVRFSVNCNEKKPYLVNKHKLYVMVLIFVFLITTSFNFFSTWPLMLLLLRIAFYVCCHFPVGILPLCWLIKNILHLKY